MSAIIDHIIYNQIAYLFYMMLVSLAGIKKNKLLEFASWVFGLNKYQHLNKKLSKSSRI